MIDAYEEKDFYVGSDLGADLHWLLDQRKEPVSVDQEDELVWEVIMGTNKGDEIALGFNGLGDLELETKDFKDQ